jgi:hypothetical protein
MVGGDIGNNEETSNSWTSLIKFGFFNLLKFFNFRNIKKADDDHQFENILALNPEGFGNPKVRWMKICLNFRV